MLKRPKESPNLELSTTRDVARPGKNLTGTGAFGNLISCCTLNCSLNCRLFIKLLAIRDPDILTLLLLLNGQKYTHTR